MLGFQLTKQRSNHRRYPKHSTKETNPLRTRFERSYTDEEDHRTSHHARCPDSGNRTAKDKGDGIGSGAADCTPDLENADDDEEDVFGSVEGIDAAEEELKGGAGQEEG